MLVGSDAGNLSCAEGHCKAGHVGKSKSKSKKFSKLDSDPSSPASGSEASFALEPKKENKHKSRLARLFKRHPKGDGASPDANSAASLLPSQSPHHEVVTDLKPAMQTS